MKLPSYHPSLRPLWRKNILATAVLLSLSALSPAVSSADRQPIGDLEIYKSLLPGEPNLMIMIDVSESMRGSSILEDFGNCSEGGDKLGGYQQVNSKGDQFYITVNGKEFIYKPYSCQVGLNKLTGEKNAKEYDRISRLQITLIRLLADTVTVGTGSDLDVQKNRFLPDSYAIGIGIFGYEKTGEKAKILSPVGQLTSSKREELVKALINDTRTTETIVGGGDNKVTVSSALTEAGAYMMGTTPYSTAYANYSGFPESSVPKANDKYISPSATSQCSGKGIFLLTGDNAKKAPTPPPADTATTSLSITKGKMNLSLSSTSAINTCSALGESDNAWRCMGEYAQKLRSPSNPSGQSIKTATAGIGSGFNVFKTNQIKIGVDVDGNDVNVPNCALGGSDDTKYLCQLGGLRTNASDAYGNGKFYPIYSSSQDSKKDADTIAKSIVDFASGLAGISSATPAGTISVPNNPYQVSEQLPFAYLPMLQPNISATTSIWNGNLKKYQLNNGTLYGKSDKLLYSNVAGDLKKDTQDLWQSADFTPTGSITVDNSKIEAGGVYAKLTTPASINGSVRTVYVEDVTAENKPILRKLGVDTDGKLLGFNLLIDPIYTEQNKRRILSFLGFKKYTQDSTSKDILDSDGNLPIGATAFDANTVLVRPTEAVRVLGGVIHSKPASISYSATLDDNGTITTPREDYAWFGSMDGALHLVNAADAEGTETYAIIPKKMIEKQSIALVKDSKIDRVGQPYFGVDAPWLVTTDYAYDLTNKKVKVDMSTGNGMFAYGGLRMGGEALYGMDITDKSAPKIIFTITPRKTIVDPVTNVTTTTGTAGFERLGQIWSKPTAAKIRVTKSAEPIDVLLFGGGYDMKYENDDYVATTAVPAKGNAIYMINAQSGELIWSTSTEATLNNNTNTASMIHSMTGGITVLDRDNDGLMDHLYAADLGGQMFRADFENARPAKFGFTAVDNFSNKGVTRILNTTSASTSTSAKPYRFYERPVISFYRNEGISGQAVSNAGKIFALVNVVSGNRSAPLSKVRTDNAFANRVYGIIDTDVTSASLYTEGFIKTILDLKEQEESEPGRLINLSTKLGDTPTSVVKETVRNQMVAGTNKGWYYPLTRFDGYQGIKHNKGIGESVVINSLLYTTVYNPDKIYTAPQSCTTSILGGSERQIYCLPYGICDDANSKNGTGGYVPAGQGIQELTLGAFNASNTNVKVLIGTRSITDRILQANRVEYGAGDTTGQYYNNQTSSLKKFSELGTVVGGDGSAVEYLFNERYTLQPKEWYERKQ